MNMNLAPIALFVYKRPVHTQRVIEALLTNPEAKSSDLIIFADGPKNSKDHAGTKAVRQIVSEITGFRSIEFHFSEMNHGLSNSLINGITDVLERHERIIVLEDDILVSRNFLKFMNEALVQYESEPRVASIHGYVYPLESELPDTFFIRGADCWGWATWRRAWAEFSPDGRALYQELLESGQLEDFDFDGSAQYTQMLLDQIQGRNDSWAVRWYASAFLKDMLTLYPKKSLVTNIGLDGTGTHSGKSRILNAQILDSGSLELPLDVVESTLGRRAFENFFRSNASNSTRVAMRHWLREWTCWMNQLYG